MSTASLFVSMHGDSREEPELEIQLVTAVARRNVRSICGTHEEDTMTQSHFVIDFPIAAPATPRRSPKSYRR